MVSFPYPKQKGSRSHGNQHSKRQHDLPQRKTGPVEPESGAPVSQPHRPAGAQRRGQVHHFPHALRPVPAHFGRLRGGRRGSAQRGQRRAFAPGLYGPEILALSRHRGEGQHQHFRGSLRPGQKTPGRAAARAGRGPGAQGFSAQPHRGPAAPPCTNRRCFFWTNPPPEWTPAPGATSGSTSWP